LKHQGRHETTVEIFFQVNFSAKNAEDALDAFDRKKIQNDNESLNCTLSRRSA
jgi:hypothetical protein